LFGILLIYSVAQSHTQNHRTCSECKYPSNDFRDLICSLVCAYPVDNITFIISDSTSIYRKWIEGLLEKYDAVILLENSGKE
jgi:hypothetical protein